MLNIFRVRDTFEHLIKYDLWLEKKKKKAKPPVNFSLKLSKVGVLLPYLHSRHLESHLSALC